MSWPQVLFFLCSVLSKKAYLLFNILSPLDFPCVTLLSFLQTAGRSNVNVAALCKLVQGHASVATCADSQLQSWAALVDHPECLLHSMAVRYDGCVDGQSLASLVDVVARNSTLHTLRISAVIGQGIEAAELAQVARQLGPMLAKPKLQTLELAISSVDEDVSVVSDALQPLVDALCASIGKTAVSKLVLDMELSAGQVTQLGQALPTSSVRSLHLLHLSCAWNGLQALTALINNSSSSVTGLDLSGCWAATTSVVQSQQVFLNSFLVVLFSLIFSFFSRPIRRECAELCPAAAVVRRALQQRLPRRIRSTTTRLGRPNSNSNNSSLCPGDLLAARGATAV